MFTPRSSGKIPSIKSSTVNNWLKGVVTAFEDGRTPDSGLRSSENQILGQDGTIGPRPSLIKYGPQPVGTVLGEIAEFRVRTGLTAVNWMISMQNVNGVTSVYVAKDTTSWTICTGKTYDNTARAHFIQIQNKVLVMNGIDYLSFLDISAMTITPFTALTTPAAPTLDTLTGLTGTAYKVYYAVTANSTVGETDGSSILSQAILTERDLWNPVTQSAKIKWTTVTNVKSWNVYMGVSADGAGIPKMYAIATGLDATTLNFTDDGTKAQDLTRPLPTANSTAGRKVTRGDVINNRVWLTGDKDNPYDVCYGGDFGYELDFSPANGGGFITIGNGAKEVPVRAKTFRDGKGTVGVTVLTQGTNGQGKRYNLTPTTLTYGTSSFVVWQAAEDNGQEGTDSPDGVVAYNNSLWYPSRDGFKTTGTKPQLQNVISTDRVSNTIQPDISRLNTSVMDKCVGLAYEGRIYWQLPVGSTTNNEIWVLDLERDGAWMKPWSISADWMFLYNDNSGVTHHCVLMNNYIYEFSYAQMTNDDGVAFATGFSSGINKFSEDGMEWVKLIKVVFTLLRPQGAINFSVSIGTDDNEVLTFLNGGIYGSGVTSLVTGWGEPSTKGLVGWGRHAWSQVETVPEVSGIATEDIEVDVDEDAKWWKYSLSSIGANTNYQVSKVVPIYVPIGIKTN